MTTLAQTTNKHILDLVIGETYSRQVALFTSDTQNNVGYTFGEDGWGAEFALYDPLNTRNIIYICTVANGKMAWLSSGLLIWSIPASDTYHFQRHTQLSYSLKVIANTPIVDPQGSSKMIDQGLIKVINVA